MNDLTNREIKYLNNINTETDRMKLGLKAQEIVDAINDGIPGAPGPDGAPGAPGAPGPAGPVAIVEGTPVNAVNRVDVLDISGVVIHGETITIHNPDEEGSDVYEFLADAAQAPSDPTNIPVDIEADTVKAGVDLTVDTNPSLGDTMTIGTKVFIFVPLGTGSGDGQIDVGASLETTQGNIVTAIRGTDDHNDPHPLVSCGDGFIGDQLGIEALIGGVAGNSIPATESFTAGSNVFSAATLLNGTDCIADDAALALVATITAEDTQGVSADIGVPDEHLVYITAAVAGDIGNNIVTDEDMANGALMGVTPGVDGVVGEAWTLRAGATGLYLCANADGNTISGKNWIYIEGVTY